MPSNEHNRNNQGKTRKATATAPNAQAQQNVESIMRLEKEAIHSRSTADQVADRVTMIAGSTPFIILHLAWFGGWVLVNVGLIPAVTPFDPFPFSFLTLCVSLEAIFLSLLVLMMQNRMIKESDKRAHLDLQVNLLAEQEVTVILRIVKRIREHLGLPEESDEAMSQLEEKTDVRELAAKIEAKSPK